jgi:hypothetical protein
MLAAAMVLVVAVVAAVVMVTVVMAVVMVTVVAARAAMVTVAAVVTLMVAGESMSEIGGLGRVRSRAQWWWWWWWWPFSAPFRAWMPLPCAFESGGLVVVTVVVVSVVVVMVIMMVVVMVMVSGFVLSSWDYIDGE